MIIHSVDFFDSNFMVGWKSLVQLYIENADFSKSKEDFIVKKRDDPNYSMILRLPIDEEGTKWGGDIKTFLDSVGNSGFWVNNTGACDLKLRISYEENPGYYTYYKYIANQNYVLYTKLELKENLNYNVDVKVDIKTNDPIILSSIIEKDHPTEVKIEILKRKKQRELLKKFMNQKEIYRIPKIHRIDDFNNDNWLSVTPEGYGSEFLMEYREYEEDQIETNGIIVSKINWDNEIFRLLGIRNQDIPRIKKTLHEIYNDKSLCKDHCDLLTKFTEKISFELATQTTDIFEFLLGLYSIGKLDAKILIHPKLDYNPFSHVNFAPFNKNRDKKFLTKLALNLEDLEFSMKIAKEMEDQDLYEALFNELTDRDPDFGRYGREILTLAGKLKKYDLAYKFLLNAQMISLAAGVLAEDKDNLDQLYDIALNNDHRYIRAGILSRIKDEGKLLTLALKSSFDDPQVLSNIHNEEYISKILNETHKSETWREALRKLKNLRKLKDLSSNLSGVKYTEINKKIKELEYEAQFENYEQHKLYKDQFIAINKLEEKFDIKFFVNLDSDINIKYSILNNSNGDFRHAIGVLRDNVTSVILDDIGFEEIPPEIFEFKELEMLQLKGNNIKSIPDELSGLEKLKIVRISGNKIEKLPDCVGNLKLLEVLDLRKNLISTIHNNSYNLANLTQLYLSDNKLTNISDDIGKLRRLIVLDIWGNSIATIPKTIGDLHYLKSLIICDNAIKSLPDEVWSLQQLVEVRCCDNLIESISPKIQNLQSLKTLKINNNLIKKIPITLSTLTYLSSLNTKDNKLRENETIEVPVKSYSTGFEHHTTKNDQNFSEEIYSEQKILLNNYMKQFQIFTREHIDYEKYYDEL